MEAKIETKKEFELSGDSNHQEREVENIVDTDGRGKATRYLVKWKGLGDENNSWVPLAQVSMYKDLLTTFRAVRLKNYVQKNIKRKSTDKSIDDIKTKPSEPKPSTKRSANPLEDDSILEGMKQIQFTERKKINESENQTLNELSETSEKKDDGFDSSIRENRDEKSREKSVQAKIKNRAEIPPKNRKVNKASSNKEDSKLDDLKLLDLERFTNGKEYVTTANVDDYMALRVISKDIGKALKIKSHNIIDKGIYFSLKWKDSNTDSFYSKHFFGFDEITKHNPAMLLGYLKEYLNPALIN